MKKFYINVQGGTGLNIGLCSALTAFKKQYPDQYWFAVLSPYYDIMESCEAIDAVYKPNEIRDFIFDAKNADAELVMHRLYDMDLFIKKQLNYTQAWAKLLDIEYDDTEDGTNVTSELNALKKFPNLANFKDQILKAVKDNGFDDFIIAQFTGGQSPLVQVPQDKEGKPDWSKVMYNYDNEPLKRHYPTEMAQEWYSIFEKEHPKTAVVLFQLPNEPKIVGKHVVQCTVPYLVFYELAKEKNCRGTVSIDSCLQHLVAGLNRSVVLWGHSLPENFGYAYNHNIIQDCRRDDLLYFSALGPSGAKVDYIKPEELEKHVNEHLFEPKEE